MAAMQQVPVLALFALLCLSPPAAAVTLGGRLRSQSSPVTQIVTLLNDLKTKIEADGTSEQKSYDKYACWCEDTLAAKAAEITATKDNIEKLQTTIIKLKGDIAMHGADIKQLKKDIQGNLESQQEATEVREKESGAYTEEKTESEQCIGALEAAIKVLAGAGDKKKGQFLETLQEAQLLGVVAGVRGLLHQPLVSRAVSGKDLLVVRHFVDRPEDFVGGRTGVLSAAQIANNPFGDYAPQSTQIQGILKGMYDSFTGDLEKANAEESKKQKGFEELMQTKKSELKTLEDTLQKQTTDEADKTKALADSKTGIDDAQEKLEVDQEFFAQSKSSCQEKASQWAQRTRLRTEELHGINQAIGILSSDEAKATFKSAAETFLQLSSRSRSKRGDARSAAFERLRTLATKYQSLSLAHLAANVKMTGHFDKVIQSIEKMIELLRTEEQEDIEQRDWCERNQGKNKHDTEDVKYDIKKAEDEIKRLETKAGEIETQIKEVEKDVKATQDDMKALKKTRGEERDAFLKAVKDDTDAVALLGEAIKVLARFKKNEKGKFLQSGSRADPPKDTAPPATTWEGGDYQGKAQESTGIIAILEMIKEDLEKEIITGRKEEASSQVNYEKDLGALQDTLDASLDSKVNMEKQLAETNEKIADVKGFKGEKDADLKEEEKLKGNLETNCDWVKTHFKTRRTKRKAEMDGLVEAKNYLAGVDDSDGVLA